MNTRVEHNASKSRYEIMVDNDLVGIADYTQAGDTLVFPHTEIVAERRGQGLGAILVEGALDDVRARGHKVIAQCWYVAMFIEERPEYRDLLTR